MLTGQGVDVLCSDKTGTLTANQLSIRDPYVADGVDVGIHIRELISLADIFR